MTIKFIDLFAGIGGFHQAFHNIDQAGIAQTECVFASEIDKFARLCCTNLMRDSLFESSMIAGSREQLVPHEVQNEELAIV